MLLSMTEGYTKPEAKFHAIYTPRPVAMPLRSKVKQELDCMKSLASYLKYKNPWCAGMVFVPILMGPLEYWQTSSY